MASKPKPQDPNAALKPDKTLMSRAKAIKALMPYLSDYDRIGLKATDDDGGSFSIMSSKNSTGNALFASVKITSPADSVGGLGVDASTKAVFVDPDFLRHATTETYEQLHVGDNKVSLSGSRTKGKTMLTWDVHASGNDDTLEATTDAALSEYGKKSTGSVVHYAAEDVKRVLDFLTLQHLEPLDNNSLSPHFCFSGKDVYSFDPRRAFRSKGVDNHALVTQLPCAFTLDLLKLSFALDASLQIKRSDTATFARVHGNTVDCMIRLSSLPRGLVGVTPDQLEEVATAKGLPLFAHITINDPTLFIKFFSDARSIGDRKELEHKGGKFTLTSRAGSVSAKSVMAAKGGLDFANDSPDASRAPWTVTLRQTVLDGVVSVMESVQAAAKSKTPAATSEPMTISLHQASASNATISRFTLTVPRSGFDATYLWLL